jgi:hypothetical protein
MSKQARPVVFVVRFKDGTTARMASDPKILLRGDQVAYSVAAERERAKLLPDKAIERIAEHDLPVKGIGEAGASSVV